MELKLTYASNLVLSTDLLIVLNGIETLCMWVYIHNKFSFNRTKWN